MISDEALLKLWRDPSFEGSYRGARTFQVILKTNLNIDVPLQRLYKVLAKDQIYLLHQKPHRYFPRRKYYVHSLGELCQMDIAHMFYDEESSYRYFLLFVDVFSSKVFTEPLKSRETNEVLKVLQKIVSNFNSAIHVIQADRESAFVSREAKQFFKRNQIVFRPKFGKNKGITALLHCLYNHN